MTTKIEIPVTTLSNGTALVTVAPMFAFHNPSPGVNAGTLPFVSVANGNTDFPFAATPAFTASPFAGQGPNTYLRYRRYNFGLYPDLILNKLQREGVDSFLLLSTK